VVAVTDTTHSINYVSAATYASTGAIAGFVSGNGSSFAGISRSFTYNNRFQRVNMDATLPSAAKVFSITYDFHESAGDNGNVWAITNNRDTRFTGI
jgi:hypothetical protein